jgi:4-hydroxyphenylpyruvate dioxygenase
MRQSHPLSSIRGIDHVEIYVSNCHQAAHYYRTALGFTVVGHSRDEPGADRTSIAMQREDIRLLLTAPLTPSSEVAQHLHLHGEGIKDVALTVADIEEVFDRAVAAGGRALDAPSAAAIQPIRTARLAAYGDLVHSLIERPPDWLWLPPRIVPSPTKLDAPDTGLVAIDHLGVAVAAGEVDRQVRFYIDALGFEEGHREDVRTEYSAMRSKVVQTPDAKVRFPIMEPAPARRPSQIDTYIDSHHGPGVQHLAFRSNDIVKSASVLAATIEFLPTPDSYYDSLENRVGDLAGEIASLRRYGILADRDATGLLLQVFTRPIGTRPTLFLEVIERRGAKGFGSGNIKALFEAVERTQGVAVAP